MGKKVASVQGEIVNLFDLGSLMQITIGTWSGRKKLTRADLSRCGINPDGLPEDIISLGRKLLVPKDELLKFNQIEQQARGYLARWSISFGIARSQFVPVDLIPEVEAKLDEFQQQFYSLVDSFIERFEQMVQTVKDAHPEFWAKCLKPHYPSTPEKLRAKFRFQWFTFKVGGLNDLGIGVKAAKAISAVAKQGEREIMMRKKMKEEVNRFVDEAVSVMRERTVDFVELVTARVNGTTYKDEKKPKKFTARTLGCFRKFVDRFKALNIFGDDKVEQMLDELRTNFLDPAESPKDLTNEGMKKALNQHLETLRALAAAENGERSQFIGLAQRRIEL